MDDDNVIDMSTRRNGYKCLLEFDAPSDGATLDSEFVRGFEAGATDAHLSNKPATWSITGHASNKEMFRRIAERRGYAVMFQDADGESHWVFVDFVRNDVPFVSRGPERT